MCRIIFLLTQSCTKLSQGAAEFGNIRVEFVRKDEHRDFMVTSLRIVNTKVCVLSRQFLNLKVSQIATFYSLQIFSILA